MKSLTDVFDFYEICENDYWKWDTNDEDISKVKWTRLLSMMVELKYMCHHVLTCIYVVTCIYFMLCIYILEYEQEIDVLF